MNELSRLPGFDNVVATQLNETQLGLVIADEVHDATYLDGNRSAIINRDDYDSDQEFIQECRQWARANGGIEVPA